MRGPAARAIVLASMSSGGTPDELDILDLLPDALVCVDHDQRILAWNRAAERLYGYTREEAIGRRARDLLDTRHLQPLAEVLDTCRRTGGWRGALVNRAKDGRAVAVEERWSARPNEAGECVAMIALGRELVAAPAQDDEPAALGPGSLAHVAGTVAHDLNNALAVIVNYAALIAKEVEGIRERTGEEPWATLGGDVHEIRCAARRGAQLSRELFAASLAAGRSDV